MPPPPTNYDNDGDNLSHMSSPNVDEQQERHREREQAEREQELKGVECVICMSEIRDVIIMPCRHLCLCKMCATNLRVQSNNCPICRIPFIALLQIKLVRKREEKEKKKQQQHLEEVTTNHTHGEEEVEVVATSTNLPKLKIKDLNQSSNHHHRQHENCHENGLVVIGDEFVEGGGEEGGESSGPIVCMENVGGDKPISVECENANPLKLLMDTYECVTIYEVRIYFSPFSRSTSLF